MTDDGKEVIKVLSKQIQKALHRVAEYSGSSPTDVILRNVANELNSIIGAYLNAN